MTGSDSVPVHQWLLLHTLHLYTTGHMYHRHNSMHLMVRVVATFVGVCSHKCKCYITDVNGHSCRGELFKSFMSDRPQ